MSELILIPKQYCAHISFLHWNHLFPRQYTRIPWNQKVFHVWLIIKLFKFILHHSSQHQLHWQSCNMNSPTRSNVFSTWTRTEDVTVLYINNFLCAFFLFCCYEEDSELFNKTVSIALLPTACCCSLCIAILLTITMIKVDDGSNNDEMFSKT